MQNDYSDEQLRLAARLYYLDGLGQVEVAKFVKVSQAQVSRLLALARQRGIVRISVAEYEPRHQDLETRLQKELGLQAVAVIKTTAGATVEEARMTVAHFGAPFVASLIAPDSGVAISGGRTMRELVRLLPEDKNRRVTVVQAMGSIDSNVGPVDAFELSRAMARRWGGSLLTLNTPAFVPDARTRDAFLGLQQIRAVWERLKSADVALVGIGTLDNSVFVERGILSAEDLKKLSKRGAVGEICGRFYDQQGNECDSPWRNRVISIGLDQLRKIPQVIGVVASGDRSAAIQAAIKGGLIKSLVIDEKGASALLEHGSS
ncbi:MAG TPA: sugar-binding transcriptional regulator [Candidatus Binatia bacterium]|nr:sugar-binding transcriptional regulator [Candidatus Binatia bacterium]